MAGRIFSTARNSHRLLVYRSTATESNRSGSSRVRRRSYRWRKNWRRQFWHGAQNSTQAVVQECHGGNGQRDEKGNGGKGKAGREEAAGRKDCPKGKTKTGAHEERSSPGNESRVGIRR